MSRRLWALPAAIALAIGVSATIAHGATRLSGSVGPGFTITMKKGGARLASTAAGAYTIRVRDRSAAHNFHLTGPGVNRRTSVSATGTATWNVRLRRGTYRFICDPHASSMRGSFTVR